MTRRRITNGDQIARERAYLDQWQRTVHAPRDLRSTPLLYAIEHYPAPFSAGPWVAGVLAALWALLLLGAMS